jgi:hypothetical protein
MWITVFWATGAFVLAIAVAFVLSLGHLAVRAPGRPWALYREHFADERRERVFLASVSFFVAFFVVRSITYAIHAGVGRLHDVSVRGTHLHHLVWGILLLLGVGYLWLVQVGAGGATARWPSRLTALLYGVGAALTLDEFALWLRLRDVYWTAQGRESVEAVLLFGALLSVGLWGRPFFHAIAHETLRLLRGRRRGTASGPS